MPKKRKMPEMALKNLREVQAELINVVTNVDREETFTESDIAKLRNIGRVLRMCIFRMEDKILEMERLEEETPDTTF